MSAPCKCNEVSSTETSSFRSTITSIPLSDLTNLSSAGASALRAIGPHHDEAVVQQFHTTPDGGLFTSSAFAADLTAHVDLRGTLGPFPVELTLSVTVDADQVIVKLQVTKPIHLGPYEWHFKLGGVVRDAKGVIIGANTIALAPTTPAFAPSAALGGHFLCFLKCGGLAILPILIPCLPSLAGGPQAFIACVVGKAGEGAAAIAACITKCAA
jgi:hypothetical protein